MWVPLKGHELEEREANEMFVSTDNMVSVNIWVRYNKAMGAK